MPDTEEVKTGALPPSIITFSIFLLHDRKKVTKSNGSIEALVIFFIQKNYQFERFSTLYFELDQGLN